MYNIKEPILGYLPIASQMQVVQRNTLVWLSINQLAIRPLISFASLETLPGMRLGK